LMAKTPRTGTKNPVKSDATAAAGTTADAPVAEPTMNDTDVLTAADRRFLERVSRFLINIQLQQYLPKARQEAYTDAEHELGWRLWKTAAGENRPLSHWIELSAVESEEPPELASIYQELDAFENTWFPRAHAIIRRVVATELRDAFEKAFFHELTQQPLGPLVVGSVRTFIKRFDELPKSSKAGARAVYDKLVQRGMDSSRVNRVRELLVAIESNPVKPRKRTVSAEEIAQATRDQTKALGELHDWFDDWATTLRSVFNAQEQTRLGLSVPSRGGDDAEEEQPATPPGAPENPSGTPKS